MCDEFDKEIYYNTETYQVSRIEKFVVLGSFRRAWKHIRRSRIYRWSNSETGYWSENLRDCYYRDSSLYHHIRKNLKDNIWENNERKAVSIDGLTRLSVKVDLRRGKGSKWMKFYANKSHRKLVKQRLYQMQEDYYLKYDKRGMATSWDVY